MPDRNSIGRDVAGEDLTYFVCINLTSRVFAQPADTFICHAKNIQKRRSEKYLYIYLHFLIDDNDSVLQFFIGTSKTSSLFALFSCSFKT